MHKKTFDIDPQKIKVFDVVPYGILFSEFERYVF